MMNHRPRPATQPVIALVIQTIMTVTAMLVPGWSQASSIELTEIRMTRKVIVMMNKHNQTSYLDLSINRGHRRRDISHMIEISNTVITKSRI